MPHLPDRIDPRRWAEVFGREYERHCRAVDRHKPTLLDDYGAEDPAEFFAVAVENFFVRPEALKRRHPEMTELLATYFGNDATTA